MKLRQIKHANDKLVIHVDCSRYQNFKCMRLAEQWVPDKTIVVFTLFCPPPADNDNKKHNGVYGDDNESKDDDGGDDSGSDNGEDWDVDDCNDHNDDDRDLDDDYYFLHFCTYMITIDLNFLTRIDFFFFR